MGTIWDALVAMGRNDCNECEESLTFLINQTESPSKPHEFLHKTDD